MIEINQEEMKQKIEKMNAAKEHLKSHFVGIDEMIERVFKNLEVWYLMPSILARPTIINLWGMTGVGKTDLVRKLVSQLDMNDKFAELQLTNKPIQWNDSIQGVMESAGLQSNEPGILLLDEIQRFRSIDEKGKMLHNYAFDDIWALLSDGKFTDAAREKNRLYMMLMDIMYDMDYEESRKDQEEEPSDEDVKPKKKKRRKFQNTIYSAKQLKGALELKDSIKDIMTWPLNRKISAIEHRMNYIDKTKTTKSYPKLLIFICGNLDEAYKMASQTADTDVDADILHEATKKITVLTVKSELRKQFKPEQIARFGNNHIIYPSLSKSSYQELINRKISEIQDRIKETFNINLWMSDKVNKIVYRNGVYPTQGARPVFSTINSIIENPLPHFLFNSIVQKNNTILFDIDDQAYKAVAKIGSAVYTRDINLQIDEIKNKMTSDELAVTAVHEAGHAVAYSLIFGVCPAQIVVNGGGNAFIFPHSTESSKLNCLNMIKVLYSGQLAEELVFGISHATAGAENDLWQATKLAGNMIRAYGMGKLKAFIHIEKDYDIRCVSKVADTNDDVLEILTAQRARAEKLLMMNIDFLRKVVDALISSKGIKPEQFLEIAKPFVPDLKIVEKKHEISDNYYEKVNEFLQEGDIKI